MSALINDITQLKSVLGGVQKTMQWLTWEPFVKQARYAFIEKVIGEKFYEELSAIANPAGTALGLIERLKNAEGYYAYAIAFPQLIMVTGDGGIAVSTPDKTQAMGKWMYVNTIKQLSLKADTFLEEALVYLENHKADFETWTSSDVYTITHSSFLSSATELSKYFPAAKSSRRIYLSLREYIDTCEDFQIRQILGDALYDFWKSKLIDDSYTWKPSEKLALKFLRFSLANNAFAQCISYLNINEDFRLVSETDGILNEDILTEARRNELKYKCENDAAMYASELRKYLDSNASDTVFPLYFNSDNYTSTVRKSYELPTNDPTKPYFRM